MSESRHVAIVGAGISGLACAVRLRERGVRVTLLEASDHVGGVIGSKRVDGFLLETGPNSILNKLAFTDLVKTVGLESEMIQTPMREHPRFVFKRGKGLCEVPTSPLKFLTTSLLGLRGKMALLREPFLRGVPEGESSVADFARRHVGEEMYRMMLAPFISGVYAGDPETMSLQGALPRMQTLLEQGSGSLVRGVFSKERRHLKKREPKRRSALCAFPQGLARLPEAIGQWLGDDLRLNTPVEKVIAEEGRWRLRLADGEIDADALVIATPAPEASELLRIAAPGAANALSKTTHTAITVVHLGVPLESLKAQPRGFGFLVPRDEGLRVLGTLWMSAVFGNRAPEGQALLTVFIGGATDPEAIDLSDADLMAVVEADLKTAMGWDGRRTLERITRWRRGLPEYRLGHLARLSQIDQALKDCPAPLWLLGNHLRGISVPDCIERGGQVAEEITTMGADRP